MGGRIYIFLIISEKARGGFVGDNEEGVFDFDEVCGPNEKRHAIGVVIAHVDDLMIPCTDDFIA